jgi:hypothetical protein
MPNKIKLFRSDDDPPYVDAGSWWTPDISVARAYVDNPGFGGDSLFSGVFSASGILDLRLGAYPDQWSNRDAIRHLAFQEFDQDWLENVEDSYLHEVLDRTEVRGVLSQKYIWVIIYDSFPEGAETWQRLRDLTSKEENSIRKIK